MLDKLKPPFNSLVDLITRRAAEQADERGYVFLSDKGDEEAALTFGELHRRAVAVAAHLRASGSPGDRALLLFGAGLDFIVAYFGCVLAGVIAVPMMLPRRNSSLGSSASIAANANPRFLLTSGWVQSTRPDVIERFSAPQRHWIITDQVEAMSEAHPRLPIAAPDDIAFLQYTSGSTSDPKGVMVAHRNLIENLEMMRQVQGNTRQSTYASWIPLYHDMGLVGNVLQSLYVGSLCVLLAPITFMQRPLSWLRAISRYRAQVAGGPNFAFDLCAQRFRVDQMQDVDLSCWEVAFNGAEPVRADTIERFATTFAPYGFDPRAMNPQYGLAEATVMISAGPKLAGPVIRSVGLVAFRRSEIAAPAGEQDKHRIVGCGRSVIGGRLAIVDPQTSRRLEPDRVGEIWVSGSHVCQGYWQSSDATRATFKARIEGEQGDNDWLRTGDLGFMDESGEIFITGRAKDMIIVRGINYYPQDIENTVYNSHSALRRHFGAVFSVASESGEKLVLVQEVERMQRRKLDTEEIIRSIREVVANEHEISLDSIVLISPGEIPKTTSGKIQRSLTRQMWLQNTFEPIGTAPVK
jgi:acyl-CoA synthetase (AMP-forming)/AMP-acid ligase II